MILDEFKRVHERLGEHDGRFDNIDADLSNQRATLKAIHNELDDLYVAQGRYSEAEPLCKRSLAIAEKTLGATACTRLSDFQSPA